MDILNDYLENETYIGSMIPLKEVIFNLFLRDFQQREEEEIIEAVNNHPDMYILAAVDEEGNPVKYVVRYEMTFKESLPLVNPHEGIDNVLQYYHVRM